MILAPGETYDAPDLLAAYSARGLDGISAAFHGFVRSRPPPDHARKVLLSTWEGGPSVSITDSGAHRARRRCGRAGVETLRPDDGWFGSRRNDAKGLGDWVVSQEVWPDGLGPLDHVRSRDLGRASPWPIRLRSVAGAPGMDAGRRGRDPLLARHQQVIDLANEECFAHILGRLDALLATTRSPSSNWDDNRGLTDAAHEGRAAAHGQTIALYRLFDTLRERHPDVEFETCASGGGRVDLGILARTDRLWASDTIDAIERQQINLGPHSWVPPELIGQHIGGPHAHTTGRTSPFPLRVASAVFGHLGISGISRP